MEGWSGGWSAGKVGGGLTKDRSNWMVREDIKGFLVVDEGLRRPVVYCGGRWSA